MATKCTWLIQLGTISPAGNPARLAGYSESWYSPDAFSTQLLSNFTQLAIVRASLLPASGTIVGLRFQQTNGVTAGASVSQPISLPGTSGSLTDAPQIAIKIQLNAAAGLPNKKILILRGVPDDCVAKGEFNPTTAFRTNLTTFLANLVNTPWLWRGRDLTAVSYPILTVTPLGAYQLSAPSVIPANTVVQVLRSKNLAGRQKGGFFFVTTPTAFTGTLLNWNHGDTTGGRMRTAGIVFPAPRGFLIPPIVVAIVKKVGRPFSQYRGRAPVKSPG